MNSSSHSRWWHWASIDVRVPQNVDPPRRKNATIRSTSHKHWSKPSVIQTWIGVIVTFCRKKTVNLGIVKNLRRFFMSNHIRQWFVTESHFGNSLTWLFLKSRPTKSYIYQASKGGVCYLGPTFLHKWHTKIQKKTSWMLSSAAKDIVAHDVLFHQLGPHDQEEVLCHLPLLRLFTAANYRMIADRIWSHTRFRRNIKEVQGPMPLWAFFKGTKQSTVANHIWYHSWLCHLFKQLQWWLPLHAFLKWTHECTVTNNIRHHLSGRYLHEHLKCSFPVRTTFMGGDRTSIAHSIWTELSADHHIKDSQCIEPSRGFVEGGDKNTIADEVGP